MIVHPEWNVSALDGGRTRQDRVIAHDLYTIDSEKDEQTLEKDDEQTLEKDDEQTLEKDDEQTLEKDEQTLEKDEQTLEKDEQTLEKDEQTLEKDERILDQAAESYEFSRYLELPKTLSKCVQDCNVKGIKVRHKVKFNIQLHNPDGHISELRANLPVTLYISPSLPIDENNDLVDQPPQASRATIANDIANSTHPGEDHPDTITAMNNLAITLSHQGKLEETGVMMKEILEKSRHILGEDHPTTITAMNNLASTYRNQRRWQEAETLQVRVMEARKRVLGEEHPDTLASMSNLASTYSNQGRWQEAETLQVREIETRLKVLGEEHPDALTNMAESRTIARSEEGHSDHNRIGFLLRSQDNTDRDLDGSDNLGVENPLSKEIDEEGTQDNNKDASSVLQKLEHSEASYISINPPGKKDEFGTFGVAALHKDDGEAVQFSVRIDTASDFSLISDDIVQRLGRMSEITPTRYELTGLGHHEVEPKGVLMLDLFVGGKEEPFRVEFYVLTKEECSFDVLLSAKAITRLGLSVPRKASQPDDTPENI